VADIADRGRPSKLNISEKKTVYHLHIVSVVCATFAPGGFIVRYLSYQCRLCSDSQTEKVCIYCTHAHASKAMVVISELRARGMPSPYSPHFHCPLLALMKLLALCSWRATRRWGWANQIEKLSTYFTRTHASKAMVVISAPIESRELGSWRATRRSLALGKSDCREAIHIYCTHLQASKR
jgi:hypothetical protein